jgi:hypothetical protein
MNKMAMDINLNITVSQSKEAQPLAEQLLLSMLGLNNIGNNVKEMIMALSVSVQRLVDQVAASKSLQAASAAALTELVNQSAALSKQIADLVVSGSMSAEDMAAIDQASTDLADAAVALQAAVPVNTPPAPAPVEEIPPATPPA